MHCSAVQPMYCRGVGYQDQPTSIILERVAKLPAVCSPPFYYVFFKIYDIVSSSWIYRSSRGKPSARRQREELLPQVHLEPRQGCLHRLQSFISSLCSMLSFFFFLFVSFTIFIYDYNGLPRSSTPSVGAYEYLFMQKGKERVVGERTQVVRGR